MHGTTAEWRDLIRMMDERYPAGHIQVTTFQARRKKDWFGMGSKWYRYETSLVDSKTDMEVVDLDSLEHAANRTYRDDGIAQRGWEELAACVRTAVECIEHDLAIYHQEPGPGVVPLTPVGPMARVILIGSSQGGTVAAATAAHLCQRGTPPGALLLLRSTILAPHLDTLLAAGSHNPWQKLWMVQFVAQCDSQYGRARQEDQAQKLREKGHIIDTVPSGITHWDPIDFADVLACIHTAFVYALPKPKFRCVGKRPPTFVT